jgi:hypothetical protein
MRTVAPRALLCHTPLERSLHNQRLSKLATAKMMITSRETPISITEIKGNPRADSNPVSALFTQPALFTARDYHFFSYISLGEKESKTATACRDVDFGRIAVPESNRQNSVGALLRYLTCTLSSLCVRLIGIVKSIELAQNESSQQPNSLYNHSPYGRPCYFEIATDGEVFFTGSAATASFANAVDVRADVKYECPFQPRS